MSADTPFDKLLSAMDSALSSTDGRSVFAAAASRQALEAISIFDTPLPVSYTEEGNWYLDGGMNISQDIISINDPATSLSVALVVTRVASAVVAVLDNGSIHVERGAAESATCAPFVRDVNPYYVV